MKVTKFADESYKLEIEMRERENCIWTYGCTVAQLMADVVLAVLCSLNGPRSHAPWATLASWLLVGSWLLLLFQLCRLHWQAVNSVAESNSTWKSKLLSLSEEELQQEFVYTGETYVGLLSSLALTFAAIWTAIWAWDHIQSENRSKMGSQDPTQTDTNLYAPFDIWVPIALGFQASLAPAFTKMMDKLGSIAWKFRLLDVNENPATIGRISV